MAEYRNRRLHNLLTLPINLKAIGYPISGASSSPPEKRSFFRRLSSASKPSKDEVAVIAMTADEYRDHWARDKRGEYLHNVIEPPGGRIEWVRRRIESQDVEANRAEFERRSRMNDQTHLVGLARGRGAVLLP